jgi:serine/threonine protein kinase/Tol biopolymer transport system component
MDSKRGHTAAQVMNERWKEVESILRAALTRASDERASFVAEACAGDSELRREIESLLARETSTNEFLSTPAVALLAAREETAPYIGREFGAYTIVDLLGSGGMGHVYRARDRQLDRDVAIKLLPPVFTKDEDRLIRFEREAKILAALNHPHIGSIYGLERVDTPTGSGQAVPALVLELVEGPTLAERLLDGPLTSTDAVAIATQIADALEAAHRQGIIHRDLKPANIKVTASGFVKLLDFGLAKGVDHDDSRAGSVGVAASPTTSRPGAIMGTAAYMSPEQARGEAVDARSDLFSLGAVIYEMITGSPPFSGATSSAILHAILNETPASPRAINPLLPASLERVVMRLLAKDRGARHQSASDLRTELQRVTRELEAHAHRWRLRLVRVGGVTAAALLLAFAIWAAGRPVPVPVANREYPQITHFADSATSPALSSDGRMLTFIRGANANTFFGSGQIYVKALPDGEPIALTSDGLAKMSPVFSPDDSTIAYTTVTSQFAWDTWTVPVRGGNADRWVENASGLDWLRDGRLIFSEQTGGLHMRVITADAQRKATRLVYAPAGKQGMAHRSAVSPDGAWTLIVEMDAPVWQPCRLVPSDGQSAGRRVGPDGQCTNVAWSPDGTWMYFSSNSTGAFHLWRQRFPNGAPEQLTYGPTEEEGIAPDPDGRSVLTSVGTRHQSIWIRDERGEREISREGYAFVPTAPQGGTSQPLPGDGRSVFYLLRQGPVRFSGHHERAGELWATDIETGRSRSILPGRPVIGYDISRDGTQVAFAALDQAGSSHVWLARLDGSDTPRRLTEFVADSPRFDATGNIFCRRTDKGTSFIYRLREGHAPEKAIQQPVLFFLTTSPAGDWLIAKVQPPGGADGSHANMAFSTTGADPVRLCDDDCDVDWTPNGRSLVIRLGFSRSAPSNKTVVVALEPGTTLPPWPARGIHSRADVSHLRITREIDGLSYPSDTGSAYVFTRSTTQRNIHRVPLP